MHTHTAHVENTARVMVALAHEVVTAAGPFATLLDFAEELKCACARHHVPYDARTISLALTHVLRVRPAALTGGRPAIVLRGEDFVVPLPQARVLEILSEARRRAGLHRQRVIKTFPRPGRTTTHQRALEAVAREMQASLDRCAVLEAGVGR